MYTIAIAIATYLIGCMTVTAVYLEYHSLLQRNSHDKSWNQHIYHEEGYNKNDIYNQLLLTIHNSYLHITYYGILPHIVIYYEVKFLHGCFIIANINIIAR